MLNMRNYGVVEGRLVREPAVFQNGDGSKKIKFTVAAQDNYKSTTPDGKKEKGSQFINLEAFVPAGRDKTVYDLMHKGDMIGAQFSVRTNNYEKNGEIVYDQVLFVESVDLKETKSAVEARRAAQPTGQDTQPVAAPELDAVPDFEDEDNPF